MPVENRPGSRRPRAPPCHGLSPRGQPVQTTRPPPCVLAIDDEPGILGLLRRALPPHGFTVLTADGGQAGVELYRVDPDAVGVVLLDVRMPGLDGPATLAALRQIRPGLP